jgi:hypothetical protein
MMTDAPVVVRTADGGRGVLAQKILVERAKIFLELFDVCHVYTDVPPKTGDSEANKKRQQESEG